MKKKWSLIFTGMLLLVPLTGNQSEKPEEIIDFNRLRANGNDWMVIRHDVTPSGGSIKLVHDKWLMYFLHWRPLTEKRKNISVPYVRRLLLSFWGPGMPFTVIGDGGETKIAGHDAYHIDGSIYEEKIRTRFIVWNCPETGRQFIADCNINLEKGTPLRFLKLQIDVSATIQCHEKAPTQVFDGLQKRYRSEKFKLSFNIPNSWKIHKFKNKTWFPKGMSEINGTLWTLPTDSVITLDLFWDHSENKISSELLEQFVERIKGSTYIDKNVTFTIDDIEIVNIQKKKDHLTSEGNQSIGYRYQDAGGKISRGKSDHIIRTFLWKNKTVIYFMMVSLLSRQSMWNQPLDLSPTAETIDLLINQEILPAVKVFTFPLSE